MHDDHQKLMYIIQMKYRAAKKMYRKYRDEAGSDDEMDINIIKQHVSDVENFMIALYHS
jgi:hypothetical protein